MAVLQVVKFDIRPEMAAAYVDWAMPNVQVQLSVPGIVEIRSHRPIAGSAQAAITYEFADMAAFATWRSHPEIERIWAESRTYVENISVEIWGPSPAAPAPLRPE